MQKDFFISRKGGWKSLFLIRKAAEKIANGHVISEAGCYNGGKACLLYTSTGKKAGVPVGDQYLGRVVNALGEAIDGLGKIESDDYYPVEHEAPGIVDRKSVGVPMETGILLSLIHICNLYFQIRQDGENRNPLDFLSETGTEE